MKREEAIKILSRPFYMAKVPRDILEAHKMAIDALEKEPKWIPVSERLPEQYGNYLVSIDGDEIDIGTIDPDAKNKGWSLCDANGFYWATEKGIKVTAWMPLPKPYNESEVEKYDT